MLFKQEKDSLQKGAEELLLEAKSTQGGFRDSSFLDAYEYSQMSPFPFQHLKVPFFTNEHPKLHIRDLVSSKF